VVAVRGLVVIVPLVGWAPLQPPDAVQDCAPVTLHCKLVEVPLATLVFLATSVTAGLATWLSVETDEVLLPLEVDVSADEESWHAANAAKAANPSVQLNRRTTLADVPVRRAPVILESRPRAEVSPDSRLGWRPSKIIYVFPFQSALQRVISTAESSGAFANLPTCRKTQTCLQIEPTTRSIAYVQRATEKFSMTDREWIGGGQGIASASRFLGSGSCSARRLESKKMDWPEESLTGEAEIYKSFSEVHGQIRAISRR
jgi:hypothetical protein